MKDKQDSVMKMFNLPNYVKNKTFAEASKAIAERFEGLDDADSQATLRELQERLQQAQEYVKKQSEPVVPSLSPPVPGDSAVAPSAAASVAPEESPVTSVEGEATNDYFLGGLLGGEKVGPGAGGLASMAGAALDLGMTAFGKPNVDTSGATEPGSAPSDGAAALGSAVKGAQAGMAFGPWGAAVGGLVGAGAGLLGNKKAKEAERDARIANTGMKYKETTNMYNDGGTLLDRFKDLEAERPAEKIVQATTRGLDFSSVPTLRQQMLDNIEASKKTTISTPDIAVDSPSEGAKFNPASLLRYAPAVANAAQLATLEKPEMEGYDRLGNVYEKQYVDEKSIQNIVGQDVAGMRDRIVSASGGSGSAARANLLASQLKGTQALSDAYMKAESINRAEDSKAQEFKLNVDSTNLNQSNIQTQANAANRGAYDTQKSKLIAALGNDLGGIGQEELFKSYPELMGMDYNQRGQYLAKIRADKAKKEALREANKSKKN